MSASKTYAVAIRSPGFVHVVVHDTPEAAVAHARQCGDAIATESWREERVLYDSRDAQRQGPSK